MSEQIRCSVVIPTKNSAEGLPILLESVKDFSDVAICDGWSEDNTREVASAFGARVEMQDRRFLNDDGTIKDFAGIRNQCTDIAREKWVLNIDTGDFLGESFGDELRKVIDSGVIGAFWINRIFVYGRTVIECASNYPSRQIRLYHKDAVVTWIKPIHERVELKPGITAQIFPASLYTPMMATIAELKKKWSDYIALECARKHDYSFRTWLRHTLREGALAVLFLFRIVRVRLFCRGTKQPITIELMRLWYQWKLLTELLRKVRRL
ncbi:MAG: Lipopolysaccharide core biosynthesis glycosyl transferase WaaE [Parcubacteria group bacterium GW2011_GWA2_51_10]|nr:MAG: Lipopolysaccharide core biosynthesis glycosyl transferase WaaE [Parcubacteria group bacterium GW2011_GWA2_51_10]